jgi:Lar family restriction alleviation protein
MSVDLKPCPFCGGKASFEQRSYGTTSPDSVRLGFSIRCIKCGTFVPGADGYIAINLSSIGELNIWHDDRKQAFDAWNRRAET